MIDENRVSGGLGALNAELSQLHHALILTGLGNIDP
jgi:hypothetical protein